MFGLRVLTYTRPLAEDDTRLTEKEAARRRDEVIKRMRATPPQPRAKPPSGSRRGQPPKASSATQFEDIEHADPRHDRGWETPSEEQKDVSGTLSRLYYADRGPFSNEPVLS